MSNSNPALIAQWKQVVESGDFEATYAALDEVVALLESGGLSLSVMTDCYEVGLRLAARCSDLLRNSELRVSMLEATLIGPDELISPNPMSFEE